MAKKLYGEQGGSTGETWLGAGTPPKPTVPKPAVPKPAPPKTISSGGGGGGGGGGFGGGGGVKPPSLQAYKPDTSVLGYYRPDYGQFESSWQDVFNSLGGLRDAHGASSETAKANLLNAFNKTNQNIADSRLEGSQQFSKGRADVIENIYENQDKLRTNLASRGLSNSGISELADTSARMQAGNIMNDMAGEYYATEKALGKNAVDAQDNYNEGTKGIENASGEYLANLMQQEAGLNRDKYQSLDSIKRQEEQDRMGMESTKHSWNQTYQGDLNQIAMYQANWEQTQREFQAQQANAQRSYNAQIAGINAQRDSASKSQALAQAKWDFEQKQALNGQYMKEAEAYAGTGGAFKPSADNPFIRAVGTQGASPQAQSFGGGSSNADKVRKDMLNQNNANTGTGFNAPGMGSAFNWGSIPKMF